MKNQQQEDTFQQLIQRAWDEVREDEQHQLRPMTRLKLYGALIGDLDTSLFELIVNEARRFPEQSHGLQ